MSAMSVQVVLLRWSCLRVAGSGAMSKKFLNPRVRKLHWKPQNLKTSDRSAELSIIIHIDVLLSFCNNLLDAILTSIRQYSSNSGVNETHVDTIFTLSPQLIISGCPMPLDSVRVLLWRWRLSSSTFKYSFCK